MAERVPSSYKDLREFIAYLDKRGQLRRVRVPVSSELEITEITDRVSKSRDANFALLFENVRGHNMPVLINALGSRERMAWALGLEDLDELRERMSSLVKPEVPAGLIEKAQKLGELSEVVRYRPKTVSS